MSIIYDALKKMQKNSPATPAAPISKLKKKTKKKIPLLFFMTFIFAASILYVTNPLKRISQDNKPDYAKRIARKTKTKKRSSSPFTLSGIIYSPDKQFAIINGKALSVGESIKQAKVTQIKENSVVLSLPDKKIQLAIE